MRVSTVSTTIDPRLSLPLFHPKYPSAAIPPATNWHDGCSKFLSVWRLSDNRVSIAFDSTNADLDWWASSLAKIVNALADRYQEHHADRDAVTTRILDAWRLNPLDLRKDRDIQVASRSEWDSDVHAKEVLAAWASKTQTGALSGDLHWANPGAWGRVLARVVSELANAMASEGQEASAIIGHIRCATEKRLCL